MVGVESQVDWTQADKDDKFHDIFGKGEDRKRVSACNTTELIARAQPGGTAIISFGTFSQHMCPPGIDASSKDLIGLGRQCSLKVSMGQSQSNLLLPTGHACLAEFFDVASTKAATTSGL